MSTGNNNNLVISIVLICFIFFILFTQKFGLEESSQIAEIQKKIETIELQNAELEVQLSQCGAGSHRDEVIDAHLTQLEQKMKILNSKLAGVEKGKSETKPKECQCESPRSVEENVEVSPMAEECTSSPGKPCYIPTDRLSYEELLKKMPDEECRAALVNAELNNTLSSPLSEDWFVVSNYFMNRENGYYVDIGSPGGSHTWFLDKCMGWNGICLQVDSDKAQALKQTRTCKVINACLDSVAGKKAYSKSSGVLMSVKEKDKDDKVLNCVTLKELFKYNNISYVNLFTATFDDPSLFATFPENNEATIEVMMIENDSGSKDEVPCQKANYLRYPFYNRGYALVSIIKYDIWVRMNLKHLWRTEYHYPRKNKLKEKAMEDRYRGYKVYTQDIKNKLLHGMQ